MHGGASNTFCSAKTELSFASSTRSPLSEPATRECSSREALEDSGVDEDGKGIVRIDSDTSVRSEEEEEVANTSPMGMRFQLYHTETVQKRKNVI